MLRVSVNVLHCHLICLQSCCNLLAHRVHQAGTYLLLLLRHWLCWGLVECTARTHTRAHTRSCPRGSMSACCYVCTNHRARHRSRARHRDGHACLQAGVKPPRLAVCHDRWCTQLTLSVTEQHVPLEAQRSPLVIMLRPAGQAARYLAGEALIEHRPHGGLACDFGDETEARGCIQYQMSRSMDARAPPLTETCGTSVDISRSVWWCAP